MANNHEPDDRSEKLTEPGDPPDALLRPQARRAAVWSYLGPVIVLFAVIGIALIYWVKRGPAPEAARGDRDVIGTAGQPSPGGGNPQPNFDRPSDEIRYRGGNDKTDDAARSDRSSLTTIERALASRPSSSQRVALSHVTVDDVNGTTVWVKDQAARIAVTLPDGGRAPLRGDRVDVAGVTEASDSSVRIVANTVTVVN